MWKLYSSCILRKENRNEIYEKHLHYNAIYQKKILCSLFTNVIETAQLSLYLFFARSLHVSTPFLYNTQLQIYRYSYIILKIDLIYLHKAFPPPRIYINAYTLTVVYRYMTRKISTNDKMDKMSSRVEQLLRYTTMTFLTYIYIIYRNKAFAAIEE